MTVEELLKREKVDRRKEADYLLSRVLELRGSLESVVKWYDSSADLIVELHDAKEVLLFDEIRRLLSCKYPSPDDLEALARRAHGCRQCSNPEKHPCGLVLSMVIPTVRKLLKELA